MKMGHETRSTFKLEIPSDLLTLIADRRRRRGESKARSRRVRGARRAGGVPVEVGIAEADRGGGRFRQRTIILREGASLLDRRAAYGGACPSRESISRNGSDVEQLRRRRMISTRPATARCARDFELLTKMLDCHPEVFRRIPRRSAKGLEILRRARNDKPGALRSC